MRLCQYIQTDIATVSVSLSCLQTQVHIVTMTLHLTRLVLVFWGFFLLACHLENLCINLAYIWCQCVSGVFLVPVSNGDLDLVFEVRETFDLSAVAETSDNGECGDFNLTYSRSPTASSNCLFVIIHILEDSADTTYV